MHPKIGFKNVHTTGNSTSLVTIYLRTGSVASQGGGSQAFCDTACQMGQWVKIVKFSFLVSILFQLTYFNLLPGSFDEVLEKSDFVLACCSLNESTKGKTFFTKSKYVQTSRQRVEPEKSYPSENWEKSSLWRLEWPK